MVSWRAKALSNIRYLYNSNKRYLYNSTKRK